MALNKLQYKTQLAAFDRLPIVNFMKDNDINNKQKWRGHDESVSIQVINIREIRLFDPSPWHMSIDLPRALE